MVIATAFACLASTCAVGGLLQRGDFSEFCAALCTKIGSAELTRRAVAHSNAGCLALLYAAEMEEVDQRLHACV